MEAKYASNPAGYIAFGLIAAHAALSVYWAVGGTALLSLLSNGIQEQAALRETWFIAMVWGVAILKFLAGAAALALTRDWSETRVQRGLSLIGWATGIVLTGYGLMNVLSGVAVLAGLIEGPVDRGAEFWAYLLLWAPWWLGIGAAFLIATWRFENR